MLKIEAKLEDKVIIQLKYVYFISKNSDDSMPLYTELELKCPFQGSISIIMDITVK